MNIKEELLQLREKIMKKRKKKEKSEQDKDTYDLNDKVEEFIEWYKNNMVKGLYTDIGEYNLPLKMKNLIEKIAVWYELQYPIDEINKLVPMSCQELTKSNIQKNQHIKEMLDNSLKVDSLKIDSLKIANSDGMKALFDILTDEEKVYFLNRSYKDVVYWRRGFCSVHLHLSKNGTVEMSECMDTVIPGISNEDLEGKNIKEVVKIIREKGIIIPEDSELTKAVQDYNNWNYQKEEILNCAMYRIIERGGNRIGPKRAFLFAKEFGRDISIPMMYAIDYSDPGLRLFINEYIKAGGSKDLECLVGYFSKVSKDEPLEKVSIQKLLLMLPNNTTSFYTEEEKELHQRLIHSLKKASQKKDY